MKSLKLNLIALAVLGATTFSVNAQTSYRSVGSIEAPKVKESQKKDASLAEEEKLKKENRCLSNEKSGRVLFNHGAEGNKIMLDRIAYMCYHSFNVVYDPVTKTPVWTAQNMYKNTKVLSEFATFRRIDPNLPKGMPQATIDYGDEDMEPLSLAALEDMDYKFGTGAEKGQSIEESLYFTNTVPVVPGFKKGIWNEIEESVRSWSKDKEISVVTGVIFDNLEKPAVYGPSQIWIPTRIYKAVYEPKTGRSIAFVVPNVQVVTSNTVSLKEGTPDYWQTLPKYAFNCKGVCSSNNFITSVEQVEKAANVKLFPSAAIGTTWNKITPKYWDIKVK